MNYQKLAILVSNSDEWKRATKFLSEKNDNCKIETWDGGYPKCVFWREDYKVIDASGDWYAKKYGYLLQKFSEVVELSPYGFLLLAHKQGKTIQKYLKSRNEWVDVKDPLPFEGDLLNYRIKVSYQHFLDAMKEGKTIQYRYPNTNYGENLGVWHDMPNPTFSNFEAQKGWYRIKSNPYQKFVDALNEGKTIQVDVCAGSEDNPIRNSEKELWFDIHPRSLFITGIKAGKIGNLSNVFRIRPEPIDPYQIFKEAEKQGKKLQVNQYDLNNKYSWKDITNPQYNLPVKNYRIKPEHRYYVEFNVTSTKTKEEIKSHLEQLGVLDSLYFKERKINE